MQAKGLIAAGGEATRLGELTRVANKHLLPVGRWPMIYYPLQLMQLLGRWNWWLPEPVARVARVAPSRLDRPASALR